MKRSDIIICKAIELSTLVTKIADANFSQRCIYPNRVSGKGFRRAIFDRDDKICLFTNLALAVMAFTLHSFSHRSLIVCTVSLQHSQPIIHSFNLD